MSADRVLEQTLDDILSAIKPSRENLIARTQIIDELQTIVHSMSIFQGAIVEPFGSFVSGLSTRWGDLDISIELPNNSYMSSTAAKKKKWCMLANLRQILGRFHKVQLISSARVQIVKFRSRGMSCDVSIANLSGQMKSKLLLWIKGIDERFGDMTCVPAILPPMKDIYPGDIVSDLKVKGVRAAVVRKITETCDANIAKWKSNRYRSVNRSFLTELSVSFFSKFSDISQKVLDLGICPYTGKSEAPSSRVPQTSAIFIEDPFEQPLNAAKTVKASLMRKISETFETTYQRVSSTNQTEASLLPGLARPRVLKALGRTHSKVGSYGSNHNRTNCSVASNVASSSQVQQQLQNTTPQPRDVIQKSLTMGDWF